MYVNRQLKNTPARWIYPRLGLEILALVLDKRLDLVATWRRNGRCGKQVVRVDEYGQYLCVDKERVYLDELKGATFA